MINGIQNGEQTRAAKTQAQEGQLTSTSVQPGGEALPVQPGKSEPLPAAKPRSSLFATLQSLLKFGQTPAFYTKDGRVRTRDVESLSNASKVPAGSHIAYAIRSTIQDEHGSTYSYREADILSALLSNDELSFEDLQELEAAGFFSKLFSEASGEETVANSFASAIRAAADQLRKTDKHICEVKVQKEGLYWFQAWANYDCDVEADMLSRQKTGVQDTINSLRDALYQQLKDCKSVEDVALVLGIDVAPAAASSSSSASSSTTSVAASSTVPASPVAILGSQPIPTELSGGISAPKDRSERKAMEAALAANSTEVRSALLISMPAIPLDTSVRAGTPGTCFANNNYGIPLAGLTYSAEDHSVRVTIDGEEQTMKLLPDCEVTDSEIVTFRAASLNCDDALVSEQTFDHRFAIHSFNDGNGWGSGSQRAAQMVNQTCIRSLEHSLGGMVAAGGCLTTRDILAAQDEALFLAQEECIREAPVLMDQRIALGTTCPILMTVVGDIAHISSIGDAKIFVIRGSEVYEPTQGNRGGTDNTDCGGRIGNTTPDLRNYSHALAALQPGDRVVICSDGIHDNMDPQNLGLSPKQVNPELSGDSFKDWNDSIPAHRAARIAYMAERFSDVLSAYMKANALETLTHEQINAALLEHAQRVTLKVKLFCATREEKPPLDYFNYPGKEDHATLIVYEHSH